MTMPTWGARALRRFLLTMAMVMGVGQFFVYRTLHPRPGMPPRDVDRVVAGTGDGATRIIRDPARVRGIVAFVRARREEKYRFNHGMRDILWNVPPLHFYRRGKVQARTRWTGQMIAIEARHEAVVYYLTPAEGAELQRLLGVPAQPSDP
jgi:hypothetical protein